MTCWCDVFSCKPATSVLPAHLHSTLLILAVAEVIVPVHAGTGIYLELTVTGVRPHVFSTVYLHAQLGMFRSPNGDQQLPV